MNEPDQTHEPSAGPHAEVARGRRCFERRAWGEAWQALSIADQAAPLGVEDLELLAVASFMTGRDDDYLHTLERAHEAHLRAHRGARAVRCAFWLGMQFLFRGQAGQASGWFARAHRLLEREQRDCVEQGYLMLPAVEQQLGGGDAAYATAARIVEISERFADPDLNALARHQQGRVRLKQGQVAQGLALLDEAMVAVIADELSPPVTGLIYCSVIAGCQQVHDVSRAREWTAALAGWCEGQPEMLAFTGVCRVHRAELMQLDGAWDEAIEEARRACERCPPASAAQAAGLYQQAEVHRLRGDFATAEQTYRSASRYGHDAQPGLALLRLAERRTGAAVASIHRVLQGTTERLERTRLLPACVEIMLAGGDVAAARAACDELEAIAQTVATGVLSAMAAQARGAVDLAEGRPEAAFGSLRRAQALWQQLEVPYAAAQARVLLGLACRSAGDNEGGKLELDAARAVFKQLGAAPDAARVDALLSTAPTPHGLSRRELQVLRRVATGKTNKAIAAELFLSVKTVDRHLSNIYTKLDLPSRSAATAFAYEHKLI